MSSRWPSPWGVVRAQVSRALRPIRDHLRYFRDPLFLALCAHFELTPLQGWTKARSTKGTNPIDLYFQKLSDFSEEAVTRGWAVDRHRALRNWWTHRDGSFAWLVRDMDIQVGHRVLDYGCSISAFGNWARSALPGIRLSLADIPSPHFDFCKSYYRDFAEELIEIPLGRYPLDGSYDRILILDVFEHVVDPLALADHLVAHLAVGGRLVETFIYIEDNHKNPSNLESAQAQRDAVFVYLTSKLRLLSGSLGTSEGPRIWELPLE